jgi:hypothetical protein
MLNLGVVVVVQSNENYFFPLLEGNKRLFIKYAHFYTFTVLGTYCDNSKGLILKDRPTVDQQERQ